MSSSSECLCSEESPESREHGGGCGAHDADRVCVGGEEGEAKQEAAQRDQQGCHIVNGAPDPLARPLHENRCQSDDE